jgi:hypothetical protein
MKLRLNEADSDGDGISDEDEDIKHNGSVDSGESDPNDPLSPNTGSNGGGVVERVAVDAS